MHMADALVTPVVGATMIIAATGVTAYSINKIRKDPEIQNKIPLMGVVGAFVFAAQMINFSIPGTGSSGHIGGGVLLAAILGPEAGFLSLLSILIVQALLFGDGGLLSLGCNIINMGFFACFIGYKLIYKNIIGKGYSKKRVMTASIAASVIGLQLGAFSVVLETVSSGITKLPFTTFVMFMQPIHLVIGIVEGVVTGLVLNFLYDSRPDILEKASKKESYKVSRKRVISIFLVAALIVGGGISLLASSHPDGLEWSILKTSGSEELEADSEIHERAAELQDKVVILPDYELKFEDLTQNEEVMGKAMAGIVGVCITSAIIILLVYTLTRKKKVCAADGSIDEIECKFKDRDNE